MRRDVYSVIKRKFNSFRKAPVRSVQVKASGIVFWIFDHWAMHRLRQNGVLNGLLNFHTNRPSSALSPDFTDLWFLYQAVRRKRPRVILEFGSGCSTVVLAQALWDNQHDSSQNGGYLYSIDADPKWATVTSKALPTHLRKVCEISYSPLLEVEYNGTLGFRHSKIPDVIPNLMYLDGPSLTPERQVAVDVLDIETKLPEDFYLIIDGRQENTRFLNQHLTRRYRFKRRKLIRTQTFELVN